MGSENRITKVKMPDGTVYHLVDTSAHSRLDLLATIAQTGNVNDLIQDEGDYILFDCGTSTEVIW